MNRNSDNLIYIALAALVLGIVMVIAFGCAPKHINATPPIVQRSTCAYQENTPDNFTVYAPTNQGQRDCQEEICTTAYVCSTAPAGTVNSIERTRK